MEARVLPRAKKLVAAAKTLTVAGGKSATPTLTLRKKAKTQLARKAELALKGTVVVRDAAGNAKTFSVKATLKPKKRRWSRWARWAIGSAAGGCC